MKLLLVLLCLSLFSVAYSKRFEDEDFDEERLDNNEVEAYRDIPEPEDDIPEPKEEAERDEMLAETESDNQSAESDPLKHRQYRKRYYRKRNRNPSKCKPKPSKPAVFHWYDPCMRRCEYKGGRYVNCYRIRKDFESMTQKEQGRYLKAYYTITTKEPYKSRYAKLIQLHEVNFMKGIHTKEEFFPWHRWFILAVENMMREVDCKVTMPYWDWSIWSHDPWDNRKMWNAIHGLGGNGRKSDECVTTGPFRVGKWKTSRGGCLKRSFNGAPPDADQIAIALRENSFDKFELMTRVNIHEAMHCLINGTMCSGQSAEAPEFFFHHGFVDKIWADFQKKGPNHKNAFYPTIKKKMTAIKWFPKDLIDLDNQPGGVKVLYAEPTTHHARQIRKYLESLSFKSLEHLKRLSFSWTSDSAKTLFHLSSKERHNARYLEEEARQGVASKRGSNIFAKTISSLERVEGFVFPGGEC